MFENINHGKFFVIIGEDENNYAGYFFINSNINQNISKKPELFEMQMPIKRSAYSSFLTYDSFIACHKISLISKNKLSEQIRKGSTKYVETLTKEDEELLLNGLRNSKLYSEKEKKRYFS
jgi:hypothetical protein